MTHIKFESHEVPVQEQAPRLDAQVHAPQVKAPLAAAPDSYAAPPVPPEKASALMALGKVEAMLYSKMTDAQKAASSVLKASLEKAYGAGGISYDPTSASDFAELKKSAATKLDKAAQKELLVKLSGAGILAQLPRPEVKMEGLGTMENYRLNDDGTLSKGFGNATIDKDKLANLAMFNPKGADAGPGILRHAKVDTKEQWDGVRKLAAQRNAVDTKKVLEGSALAPAIYRYDQKTTSWVNGHEQKMAETERVAAQQSNADKKNVELPKVHTLAMTANGLADSLVHSAFIKGNEDQINDPAMRNKTLRALIEIARANYGSDTGRLQPVKNLTKAFNAYEKTGDKVAFTKYLQGGDKTQFNSELLGVVQDKSLKSIGADLRKNNSWEFLPKGKALHDNLTSVLLGENTQGKKLSRSAELALHTALDKDINVISDAGCKSGQDRTLHLFAMTLAGRGLQKDFGDKQTSAFLQNFDALAKTYDRMENPTGFQRLFSSAASRKADFEKLATTIGLVENNGTNMMKKYRQTYYDAAVKTGLPITQYSTLLPGLKWHNENGGLKGFIQENRLPINYMPKEVTLADKSTRGIMKRDWLGRRVFTKDGNAIVKGLARFRNT